jgi:Na+/H+-dicarboxylate symporter
MSILSNLVEEIKAWINRLIHKDSLFLVITIYIHAAILFLFLGWFFNSEPLLKFFQYVGGAVILNFATIAIVSGLTGRPYFMDYSDKQLQEQKQRDE